MEYGYDYHHHHGYAPPTPMNYRTLYSNKAHLQVRAPGTEEWFPPGPYPGWRKDTTSNVARVVFSPDSILVYQHVGKPDYDGGRSLKSNLFMWLAKFSIADLRDIRVKETGFGQTQGDTSNQYPRMRVEIAATCRASPTGHGLFVGQGSFTDNVFKNAQETTEPTASNCGLAKISERWASGDQEIMLSFTRTRQTVRKSGKNQVEGTPDPVTGSKVWMWHAFLKFLDGSDWRSDSVLAFANFASMSLAELVEKNYRSGHVSLQSREDGWVSVKTKYDDQWEIEMGKRAERETRFGPVSAGPSVLDKRAVTLPERPAASKLGKMRVSASGDDVGGGKRVELETLESLKDRFKTAQNRAELLREQELQIRHQAEEEEEKMRQIQLQMDNMDA